MICPVCDKDVQPVGVGTGLQELLAGRIHLLKDHAIRRGTHEMAELRIVGEPESERERETVFIDIDEDEEWLGR